MRKLLRPFSRLLLCTLLNGKRFRLLHCCTCHLEQEVPLMESKIWSYLRDYYKRNNAVFNANPETPTFISNSSYIADVGNFAPTALIR